MEPRREEGVGSCDGVTQRGVPAARDQSAQSQGHVQLREAVLLDATSSTRSSPHIWMLFLKLWVVVTRITVNTVSRHDVVLLLPDGILIAHYKGQGVRLVNRNMPQNMA